MKDPEWPDKSPAKRERQRLALERIFSEWRDVLCGVEEAERHPSPEYLAALILRDGVPDFAREYVAWRVMNPLPPGRPIALPLRPTSADELELAIVTGSHRPMGGVTTVSGGMTIRQRDAVFALWRLYAEFKIEISMRPGKEDLPMYREVQSRGVWKVRAPKAQALERVAKEYRVAATTLRDWEQRLRRGLGWIPDPGEESGP